MATNAARVGNAKRHPTAGRQNQEKRTLAGRKYRKPVVRVKRPAETTTLGAAIVAAVVSGLGLDGAGVDTTTWLTAAVGIVPFIVSAVVDVARERKEEREFRAEFSERAVVALEALASLGMSPQEESSNREDESDDLGDDTESRVHDLLDLLVDKSQTPAPVEKAKKDGRASGGETPRTAAAVQRSKRTRNPKAPPRANA